MIHVACVLHGTIGHHRIDGSSAGETLKKPKNRIFVENSSRESAALISRLGVETQDAKVSASETVSTSLKQSNNGISTCSAVKIKKHAAWR